MLVKLLGLAADDSAMPQVRAESIAALQRVLSRIEDLVVEENDPAQLAHLGQASWLIRQFFEGPKEFVLPKLPDPPPGEPIGVGCDW
jgi:hypothetical protein